MSVSNISQLVTVEDMSVSSFFNKRDKSYDTSFEEIYQKAKEQEVTKNNAKDFLNTLSEDEIHTLERYSMTPGKVDVDKLSLESAYNLLLHFSQKSDFNHDGIIQNGTVSLTQIEATAYESSEIEIPEIIITNEAKEAYSQKGNNSIPTTSFSA